MARNSVETLPSSPNYQAEVEKQYPRDTFRFWDFVGYDDQGDLHIGGVSIPEIITAVGTPVRITLPEIAYHRAKQWRSLSQEIAKNVGYTGGLDYYYATKASPISPIVGAALAAGWKIETSSEQDLFNLRELLEEPSYRSAILSGKIICNGYKGHPSRYNRPEVGAPLPKNMSVVGEINQLRRSGGDSYAEMIVTLAQAGVEISPIIDSLDELDYFLQPIEIPPMKMGVRAKSYGLAKAHNDRDSLVSRHGLDRESMNEAVERVLASKTHQLFMFHSMIGAAEAIDPATFVDSLMVMGREFFELRSRYPQLKETMNQFNMGGGVPALGFGYDHTLFLSSLLKGFILLAKEYHQKEPQFVFEFGSLVAAEAGIYVTSISAEKVNDRSGIPWRIIDGSVMRSLVDMILMQKEDYVILAGNHANAPGSLGRMGDRTCDSDGFMRTNRNNLVLLPDANGNEPDYGGDSLVVVLGTEAYERTLTGFNGVGHCGLAEPADIIVYHDNSGQAVLYVDQQKTEQEARAALGYDKKYFPILQALWGIK